MSKTLTYGTQGRDITYIKEFDALRYPCRECDRKDCDEREECGAEEKWYMYIYEGHMGSLYTSDYPLDYENLYCKQCGDSDWLIGCANTREEAWNLLKDNTDIDDSGGWNYDYVQKFINSHWDE